MTEQRERTGEEAEDNRKLKGTQSRENHKNTNFFQSGRFVKTAVCAVSLKDMLRGQFLGSYFRLRGKIDEICCLTLLVVNVSDDGCFEVFHAAPPTRWRIRAR